MLLVFKKKHFHFGSNASDYIAMLGSSSTKTGIKKGSSFITNCNQSCKEDLTIDSTLKHFINSEKDFKGILVENSES